MPDDDILRRPVLAVDDEDDTWVQVIKAARASGESPREARRATRSTGSS